MINIDNKLYMVKYSVSNMLSIFWAIKKTFGFD